MSSTDNQLRLMLQTGAYWLLWSLRSLMPKRSASRIAQFDVLRLHVMKLATRVVALNARTRGIRQCACPAPPRVLSNGADDPITLQNRKQQAPHTTRLSRLQRRPGGRPSAAPASEDRQHQRNGTRFWKTSIR